MDKFKGMSKKELAGYVWDYYKIHIIGAIIAVVIAGSFIDAMFIHPADKNYMGVIIYGEPAVNIESLGTLLTDAIVPSEMRPGYAVMADNFYFGGNPQMDMAMSQKFAALMMTGDIDIIIAPRAEFDSLVAEGVFLSLDAALPESLLSELTGRLIKNHGIDITGSAALSHSGISLTQPVAGFVSGSEAAIRAFEVLCAPDA